MSAEMREKVGALGEFGMLEEDIARNRDCVAAVTGGVRDVDGGTEFFKIVFGDFVINPLAWSGAEAQTKAKDKHLDRFNGGDFWCKVEK